MAGPFLRLAPTMAPAAYDVVWTVAVVLIVATVLGLLCAGVIYLVRLARIVRHSGEVARMTSAADAARVPEGSDR